MKFETFLLLIFYLCFKITKFIIQQHKLKCFIYKFSSSFIFNLWIFLILENVLSFRSNYKILNRKSARAKLLLELSSGKNIFLSDRYPVLMAIFNNIFSENPTFKIGYTIGKSTRIVQFLFLSTVTFLNSNH